MTYQEDPEGTETENLLKTANLTDQNVLEIGSGDGRLTWRYAQSARRITGIDPDAEALRMAASECPSNLHDHVAFVRASSVNLPFPRESFDIAILSWSF